MAFKNYTDIAQVMEEFKIRYQEGDFIQPRDFQISQVFLDEFEFSLKHINVRGSEFAICENIIYPIIKEVYKKYTDRLALWSHKTIRYDYKLVGEPDYLLATHSELGKVVVGRPLVLIVEAKKNDFDKGWGQCAAEMVASQKLNGDPTFPVYGIVSDGEVWEFGMLVESVFTRQQSLFITTNLRNLFGAIDFLMWSACEAFVKYGLLKDIKEAERQIDEGKAIPHKTALKRAQKKINAKVVKSSGKR
jgi:hypothetical protein